MRHVLPGLLLLLAGGAQAQAPAPAGPGTPATLVEGTLRDAAGQPIPGASVFLKTTFDGASTDSVGTFRFTTTSTGTLPLVASMITYEPFEQLVALTGQPLRLNLRLKPAHNVLNGVVITAGSFDNTLGKRATVFKPMDILLTPGGAADLSAALATLPGTTRVGEEGKLFVRGGAGPETTYYFDGLPVQSPYRGSTPGVASRNRLPATLFRGTALSTGGYSAEFGQALSAVVALSSYDLAPETETRLQLLHVGGRVEHAHRWANSSLAVVAEYTNLQPYYRLVPQTVAYAVAPRLRNGSVNLRHRTGRTGLLKLYASHADLAFAQTQPYLGTATPQTVTLANATDFVNATYRGELRRGWSLQTGVAGTQDVQTVRPGPQYVHDVDRAVVARAVLTNDSVAWRGALKLGVEGFAQDYRQTYQTGPEQAVRRLGFAEQRATAFAEATVELGPRATAQVGGRTEYSAVLGRWNAAPRTALAYKTGACSQVSAAWGLFYQTPDKSLLKVGPALAFERAQHWLLNYEVTRHGRTLRAEVFGKAYDQLARYDGAAPYNPAAYRSTGTGTARGVELLLRDNQTVRNLDYGLSYSFLDARRLAGNYPLAAVPTFAVRHAVSANGSYAIARLHTQLGAVLTYNSPRRYYDPNLAGYNQVAAPSFQDLSLNATYFTTLAHLPAIVSFGVTNVLGRRNVYGYSYSGLPDATGHYAGVPVLPTALRAFSLAFILTINKQHTTTTTTTTPDATADPTAPGP